MWIEIKNKNKKRKQFQNKIISFLHNKYILHGVPSGDRGNSERDRQSETIWCFIFEEDKHFKLDLPFYTLTETEFWDYLAEKGGSSPAGIR